MKKEVRRKAPDYDLYYEKIGAASIQNREAVLTICHAFLQILAEVAPYMESILPEDLRETYIYQVRDKVDF